MEAPMLTTGWFLWVCVQTRVSWGMVVMRRKEVSSTATATEGLVIS